MNCSDVKIKEYKVFHENGQLWKHEIYHDETSEYKSWYENGNPHIYEFYRKTELEERKAWDINGQIKIHECFKEGKRDGCFKVWHDNGQISVSEYWKNDKRIGARKEWYGNGILAEYECWQDGLLNGYAKIWGKNGALNTCVSFGISKAEIRYRYILDSNWISGINVKSEYNFSFRKRQTLLRLKSKLYILIKMKQRPFNSFLITDLYRSV